MVCDENASKWNAPKWNRAKVGHVKLARAKLARAKLNAPKWHVIVKSPVSSVRSVRSIIAEMCIVACALASPMRFACLTMSAAISIGEPCSMLSVLLLMQLVPTWTTMSLTVAIVGVSSVAGTAPLVLCMAMLLSLQSLLRPLVLSA